MVAALAVLHTSVYMALNHFPLLPSRALPLTWLDRHMPFWVWTIWGYFALIVLAIVLPLAIRDRRVFQRTLVAYGVAMGLAVCCFVFWPTHYPRPIPPPCGAWHHAVYSWLMLVDTPECCFPSLHIIVPVLACAAVWQDGRRAGVWLLLPVVVSVCTLTILTTKQHYAWDLLGGWSAAALGILVSRRLVPPILLERWSAP